jgi:uncharacterized protein (TIGR03086 family)
MPFTDLGPATDRLCMVVEGVSDDALVARTPCSEYSVGDLLDHLAGVTVAFGGAARKAEGESSTMAPWGNSLHLDPNWRTTIPRRLREMADAWREPHAWTGITRVGGLEQPGEIAGIVTLGELVVHGWDLARGVGLPFEPDEQTLVPLYELVHQTFGPEADPAARGQAFKTAIPVGSEAPVLDQTLGLLGRDPAWSPA